jgi:hypothetical protein
MMPEQLKSFLVSVVTVIAILIANVAVLLVLRASPPPPGQWGEVYYSHLLLLPMLGNLGLGIVSALSKQWVRTVTFGCSLVLLFLLALSA